MLMLPQFISQPAGGNIMRSKVTTLHIVGLYTQKHLTLQQIGDQAGITKQAVLKRLKKAGITRRQGTFVKSACAFCGGDLDVRRSRWKKNDQHYCRAACYHAALESHGYKPWRQGQRLARAI